jgi:hypothetical protein
MGEAKHCKQHGLPRTIRTEIDLNNLDSNCFDIQVDAKPAQVVMIFANPIGRKVVEDLWPQVKWSTDAKFARMYADEWRFTHVRVTRLPLHIKAQVPLDAATPDSLGLVVACALQRRAAPRRVVHWVGQGEDMHIAMYDVTGTADLPAVEYVPAGTVIGPPLASFSGTAH